MENKYESKYIIETGIGLQDVDNLKNSSYFISESERYIRGEISLDELDKIVSSYYENKPNEEERTEEADKIAIRIARIISEDTFTFSVGQLVAIHKHLFDGIFNHAGKFRDYNFIKKEWVLDGASVWYCDYNELNTTLDYDFSIEKDFRYAGLTEDEIVDHLAKFISHIWQVHAFEEGNTRTVAVFAIKYLRSLGFDVTNDTFAKNAWYFRNALVRANYTNVRKGVFEDYSFLIKFMRNLLLGENNALKNRELHISAIQVTSVNTTKETRIITLMRNNPSINADELALQLGVSVRTVNSIISSLKKNGQIRRVGGKRFGHWEIN